MTRHFIRATAHLRPLLSAALLVAALTFGAGAAKADQAASLAGQEHPASAEPAEEEAAPLLGSMGVAAQEAVAGAAIIGGAFAVGIVATGSLVTGLSAAGAVVIAYTLLP